MRWILLAALCAGCETFCTLEYRYALTVHVVDPAGQPICDAFVEARDGAYAEQLRNFTFGDPSGACPYAGAGERQGLYNVIIRTATATRTITGIAGAAVS